MATQAGIYGILKGRVVDNKGNPVIGASVFIMGTTKGTYVKDKEGEFKIAGVNAGTFTVRVTAVGYKENKQSVKISADETTDIKVVLIDQSIQMGEIVVTGQNEREMVKKEGMGTARTTNIQETGSPISSVTALVSLEAGVSTSGTGYSVRGSRSTETQVRVDGLDVGNQFTGGFGSGGVGYFPMVSQYAVEDVQVLTGGFSAEYGDALGGVVNTVGKTGNTDYYEGFLGYRTDWGAVWGSQSAGIEIIREGNQNKVIETGPGLKALGQNENKIEFGIGGPLPLLGKSTFFVSTNYMTEDYRNSSYEIYDPWGNNISRMPNNGTWVRNLTGRLKFALPNDINLIVGGMYGVTSWENSSLGWLYANDPARFYDTAGNGDITERLVNIPERVAKQIVGNQLVSQIMMRINHALSAETFYELTFSYNSNSDEAARRVGDEGPGFFTGFELLEPQDKFIFQQGGTGIEPGKDKVVDWYQQPRYSGSSEDGYIQDMDLAAINPLTGYIEGSSNYTGTNNPWGLPNFTVTHGNSGFSFRDGNYIQIDGSLNHLTETGEFDHNIKGGFEFRYYTQRLHSNGNPAVQNPFYDVYSDLWGGNIYAENDAIYEKTSKPYHPVRGAAYIQDQINYKGIIFSAGLRMDIFDANSEYRLDLPYFNPITADTGFADTKMKIQFSPRINVTYPITDRSIISMAYGIFFKMPELQRMYDGFAKNQLRGNEILGNPNLDVQRTNYYQIAFNQQITDDFAFDVTAYYKDIYNQIGLKYVQVVPQPYSQYEVAEYGNAKGLEFSFRKRPTNHFGFRINYTLSSVIGTATSPESNFNPATDIYSGLATFPLSEYPMGQDRTHSASAIINLIWGNNEGPAIGGIQLLENARINFTGGFSSGSPYTLFDPGGKPLSELNAERQPSTWYLNSRISKGFFMKDIFEGAGNSYIEFYLDIFNLLDYTGVVAVYNTSGDALDNGSSLYRQEGDYGATPYYEKADFGIAETFSRGQYDSFGNRLYNESADFDRNGIVTQSEKYQSYLNYLEMSMSGRGNYRFPRQVYFGVLFRF